MFGELDDLTIYFSWDCINRRVDLSGLQLALYGEILGGKYLCHSMIGFKGWYDSNNLKACLVS